MKAYIKKTDGSVRDPNGWQIKYAVIIEHNGVVGYFGYSNYALAKRVLLAERRGSEDTAHYDAWVGRWIGSDQHATSLRIEKSVLK